MMFKTLLVGRNSVLSTTLLVYVFFLAKPWAQAYGLQPPDQAHVVYQIQQGDTFNNLMRRFLQTYATRQDVLQLNRISDENQLRVGQSLRLPRHLLSYTTSVAQVVSLTCDQAIASGAPAHVLTIGSRLTEGDVVQVPEDCHITLAVEDGSLIRLPSSTTLTFSTLRNNAIETEPEVRLDLSRGRVEISVKKNRSRDTPFEITTPKSVMGVRGTEFRVGYSPEDKTAQVEVITGTVAAMGDHDALSQNVEEGQGLPIDANGRAQAIEQLLPPPTFVSSQYIMAPAPGRWLNLAPMVEAKAFVASSASTANMGGNRYTQTIQEPRVAVGRLNDTAVFYEFLAVAQSGIHGKSIRYGFCQPLSASDRCHVVFDVPIADGVPMHIDLDQLESQTTRPLIKGHTIRARHGRFSVNNLAPGRYQWTLRHRLNQNEVTQSGQFELLVIGRDAP